MPTRTAPTTRARPSPWVLLEAQRYAFYEEPCPFDWLWETKEVADALTIMSRSSLAALAVNNRSMDIECNPTCTAAVTSAPRKSPAWPHRHEHDTHMSAAGWATSMSSSLRPSRRTAGRSWNSKGNARLRWNVRPRRSAARRAWCNAPPGQASASALIPTS